MKIEDKPSPPEKTNSLSENLCSEKFQVITDRGALDVQDPNPKP